MGLEEHEAIVVAHKDRSHPHLHFVVNRVHPERATLWRKWWDYPRLERSLRAQEVELGLRVVPGRHAPVPSLDRARDGLTEGWQRGAQWIKPLPSPKRGDHEFLRDVIERAGEFMSQAHSWAELEGGLAHRGLALTVKGGGFSRGRSPTSRSLSPGGAGTAPTARSTRSATTSWRRRTSRSGATRHPRSSARPSPPFSAARKHPGYQFWSSRIGMRQSPPATLCRS